jgi:hypothetical protein
MLYLDIPLQREAHSLLRQLPDLLEAGSSAGPANYVG